MYVTGSGPRNSAFPWLTEHEITQTFGVNGETGIDLATPYHTQITSLSSGVVAGAGYYAGGGVVSVNTVINGANVCLYYQHLDQIEPGITPGASVTPGMLLGLSGGQTSGGSHPSSTKYSSGPHTEVGVNAPYGGIWNPNGYGPNYDPLPLLAQLATQAPGTPSGVIRTTGAMVIAASTAPGFAPIAEALHNAEQLRPLDLTNVAGSLVENGRAIAIRGVIVMVGLLIVTSIIWRITEQQYAEKAQMLGGIAQGAVALGAAAA